MAKTADGGGPGPTAQRSAGGEEVELRVSGKFGDNAGVTRDASRVTYGQQEMITTRVQKPSDAAQQLPEWVEVVMEEMEQTESATTRDLVRRPEWVEVVRKAPEIHRSTPGTGVYRSREQRSALLGTPQLSKGDRLTGLGLRDGNVSDTEVQAVLARRRSGTDRSDDEPEQTRGISKKQETTRSRTTVVGMAERELWGRDQRFRRRDRRPESRREPEGDGSKAITRETSRGNEQEPQETMETVGNSP
ncbi:hypothetical protein B0H16DRAFT_1705000 [Mycena metata]|uniref:Uncharacterized protein n=1 Tax=Mycena metata TaxID=1033252 RepID=A0AAD7E1Z3_9AGAR|nr:hypothetical protein B0H16DRAFT_1705000 [Mycena metata]